MCCPNGPPSFTSFSNKSAILLFEYEENVKSRKFNPFQPKQTSTIIFVKIALYEENLGDWIAGLDIDDSYPGRTSPKHRIGE
jgi:hypothetical protein